LAIYERSWKKKKKKKERRRRRKYEINAVFYLNGIEFTAIFIIRGIKFNVVFIISGVNMFNAASQKIHKLTSFVS